MRFCTILLSTLLLLSCSNSNSASAPKESLKASVEQAVPETLKAKSKFTLYKDYDLKQRVVVIPAGVTLVSKGGKFKNGTLIGSATQIKSKKVLFDRVTIKGTWNVPNISTDLFADLSYDNALRDVVALSNASVKNTITIKKGKYYFSFSKNGEEGITPASNTDLVIDGELYLKENNFKNYYIVQLKGQNIHVSGSGTIVGDKFSHTGKDGEWGMGVNFANATNCSVDGLTIKNCWGDCIYIGTNSKDCSVSNCKLDNGRRQGISITSADNVTISNCSISNVGGTAPEYAVDVEPNKNDTVRNVQLSSITINNCVGGFLIYTGKDNGSYVQNVKFSKCVINSVGKRNPFKFTRCNSILVSNCEVNDGHNKYVIVTDGINDVKIENNIIHSDKYVLNSISNVNFINNKIYGDELYPLGVSNTINNWTTDNVKDNKFISK